MDMMSNQTREDAPTDEVDIEMPMGMEDMDEMNIDPTTGEMVMAVDVVCCAPEALDFTANLAEYLPKEELDELGSMVCEYVEEDRKARSKWYDTLKKGMEKLGIYCPDDDAATGIQRVTHPLIVEAATQFQARAMAELYPPGGPVKTAVVGRSTPEVLEQADRVAEHMNYQLTIEDRGYYEDCDQKMYMLPFTGSEFDKQYIDPVTGKTVSRWVRSDRFIVPYDAKSLQDAPRYTHEIPMRLNEYRRLVKAGFYTGELLNTEDPDDTVLQTGEPSPMSETLLKLDGQTNPGGGNCDDEMTLYECYLDLDLDGFEEDIALPYVVTVDAATKKVIGVRRNWKNGDETKTKLVRFTHKKFLPGFGFYGFGLLHCIGNLGEAATEILQILIDSGAFATLQGGFKSKDAKLPGDVTLTPGEWKDCEMTSEELQRAFYTPPFKEPSQVLVSLLGTITELGQRFAATTETMVGDAATTGPVGTMVAQIEQGSKVFSGIHRRLHYACGTEFINLADLNAENLPEAYPFDPKSAERTIMRSDYDGRVDVIPVSDPNIFSSAQRIAMAQTGLQLAQSMPDIADRREAAVGLLRAMRFPNPELIFPKKAEAIRLDPVSEASSIMLGRPIKAFMEQNHQAHNAAHMAQIQQMPEQFKPMMMAHMMEHEAMHQVMMLVQMGLPIPVPRWDAPPTEQVFQSLPPQVENQVSMMAAQALQGMMQQAQQAQQQQNPQQGQPQGGAMSEEAKDAAFQREEQRKQAAFDAEQQRKNAALANEVDREDALAGIEPSLVQQAAQFIQSNGLTMSPRELALLAKTLGRPFNEVVQAISRMQMQGQGGGPAPIATLINQQRASFT